MSQMRQRAKEVRRQGAIARRNWAPDADSASWKAYAWWMRKTGNVRERENFCHYWRVVLIWTPLHFMVKPLLWLTAAIVATALVLLASHFLPATIGILTGLTVTAYLMGGIMVTMHVASMTINDASELQVRQLRHRSSTVIGLLAFLSLPVIVLVTAIATLVISIGTILIGLEEDYEFFSKARDWLISPISRAPRGFHWFRPLMVLPVIMLVLAVVIEPLRPLFISIGIIVGMAAVLFGLMLGLSWLVDTLRQRSLARTNVRLEEQRRDNLELLLRIKFGLLHPRYAHDASRYQAWLNRYTAFFNERYGSRNWESEHYHLEFISTRYYAYLGNLLMREDARVRQPGRVLKSLTAVGDFMVLTWTAVLVNKWKICPVVDMPTQRRVVRD